MPGFRATALVAVLLAIETSSPALAQLTFADALSRRRPHREEVELERFLAEAQRAAVGGLARAAEGPTTSVAAGPRDVVQAIHYTTTRAFFDRLTEAAGLPLEP